MCIQTHSVEVLKCQFIRRYLYQSKSLYYMYLYVFNLLGRAPATTLVYFWKTHARLHGRAFWGKLQKYCLFGRATAPRKPLSTSEAKVDNDYYQDYQQYTCYGHEELYTSIHQFLNKFNDFNLKSAETSENSFNLKVENLGYGITLIYSCLYNKKILFLSYSLTFLTLIVNARHVGCTVSLSYILCVFKYVTPGIFISLDKNRFI